MEYVAAAYGVKWGVLLFAILLRFCVAVSSGGTSQTALALVEISLKIFNGQYNNLYSLILVEISFYILS